MVVDALNINEIEATMNREAVIYNLCDLTQNLVPYIWVDDTRFIKISREK